MFEILTLNAIASTGTDLLDRNKFNVVMDSENPDGILLRSFNMHEMELSPNLKAVARAGAGVNNIPIDRCSEKGIVVFNTPGANANAVKELVLAGLLISARNMVDGIQWAQSLVGQTGVAKLVEKGKGQFVGNEVMGKKIGVVGLGAIGVMIANACDRLGMEVVGYDPYLSVDAAWRLSTGVQKANGLDEIFANCDYITLHVPFMNETKEMINDAAIAKMKDGVTILNFSRGELVEHQAIIDATASGKVRCYVTDFPTEELLGQKNIIPVPHLGASTEESEENCAKMASLELKNYLEFGNIINSVNFPTCEMPFTSTHRICIFNENVPDVIGSVTKVLSKNGINIEHMLNKSRGSYAYIMIDVDAEDVSAVQNELLKVEGVIRVRII